MGAIRWCIALVLCAGLAGCGGDAGRSAADRDKVVGFFNSITGQIDASYIGHRTLRAASANADLIVIGELATVTPGPVLGGEGPGSVATNVVTARVDEVVAGEAAPGTTVGFLMITDDADEQLVSATTVPSGRVMLMLVKRSDGQYEISPQGLLLEHAGAVTAPLAEVEGESPPDGYVADMRKNRTLKHVEDEVKDEEPAPIVTTPTTTTPTTTTAQPKLKAKIE